ncbi:MAG: hypothetical protein KBT22_00985 [Bacteroidales bacterium]|nr:hypothetical protein [Candidatus Scybalocola fimicaballi]
MSMMISLSSRMNGKSKKDNDIKWNFEKFLVDRSGNVVKRFDPTVAPEQIESEIKNLL